MKNSEMEIMRSVSMELDPETMLLFSYQYHTEKDPDDPAGQRNLRSKSRYRYLCRVMKKSDVEARSISLGKLENRTGEWKWPDDPSWQGEILYMKDSSNAGFSNWLRLRLRKCLSWEEGQAVLRGMKKEMRKSSPSFGKYTVGPVQNAIVDVSGFMTSSGETVSLDDRDSLLRHVGENIWKEIPLKSLTSMA